MILKREIALSKKVAAIFLLLILGFSNSIFAQLTVTKRDGLPDNIKPAEWINISLKTIHKSSKELASISVPSVYENDINSFNDNLNKLKLNHNAIKAQSNLRNFYNLRNQFGLLIEQANRINKKMKNKDAVLTHQLQLISQSTSHSLVEKILKDSLMDRAYSVQFKNILLSLDSLKNKIEPIKKAYSNNISVCNYIILSAKEEDDIINREMDDITRNLLHPEEPSFMHLSENNYPAFGPTFKTTCQQKADLLLNYSKASLWDLILLRVVVLIFAFVPLWYVKKIFRKNASTVYTSHFRYVHKYTALMAPTVMLILAPILFRYPPMLLLDLLFMTIAFSVMTIIVKDNQSVNKKYLFGLLIYYVVLKIDNLLVTVTLSDRIAFAFSIFTLPIFYLLLKWVKKNIVEHRLLLTVMLYGVMACIFSGWLFNMNGNFILAKNITLAAFEGLFFMLMLHFSINGIGDYILMTGDYFHRKNINFNPELLAVHFRIRPFLIFAAFLYWVIAFLMNLNLFHFIASPTLDYLRTPKTIGNFSFSIGNLLTFTFSTLLVYWIYKLLRKMFGFQIR